MHELSNLNQIEVSRLWVQTVVPEPFRYDPSELVSSNRYGSPREENEIPPELRNPYQEEIDKGFIFFPMDIVCICVGKHAGRWGIVAQIEEKENLRVVIRGREGQEDELVRILSLPLLHEI